ncbi:MAG: FtsX-like permease family protein [Treponema sp.]|nr:FtsX-like permease family protein [Treponema sp.]
MKLKASLMFARSLIFPKAEKNSSARRSMMGALLCIGLSLVPLIVVLTVTNGMIEGMTERLIGLSSSHLEALIARNSKNIVSAPMFQRFADEVKTAEGVTNVYPQVTLTALAGGKKERTGAQVRCLPGNIFEVNDSFGTLFSVVEGNLAVFSEGEKTAVIGQKLSEILELSPGDSFRLITTKTGAKNTMTPKLTTFKVAAIVSSGYQELDALWVFIPIDVAYASVPLNTAEFSLLIETEDAFSPYLSRVRMNVEQITGRHANVFTWSEMNASEFENFSSTKVMLVFIMILIVLVASVNISSAIVMLVMERRKEIAILKSTGASNSGITFAFLIAGLACGTGGVLIGLPVGLLFAVNANSMVSVAEKIVNWFGKIFNLMKGIPLSEIKDIHLMDPAYYLSEIPVNIPFSEIFGIIAATLILSLLVSYIPAYKAGKEKPISLIQKN